MSHRPLSPAAPPALAPASGSEAAVVDVSVVIVTYNVREFLDQALRSVESASAGLTVETFVVDNDSADGTAAHVAERFPDVRLIANEENVGFAVANNQALREAAGRYVLVLNPDTILQEDTLRELVAFMDAHPDAGAAGCRILNPDGTFAPESRRAFPTPAVAFYRISGLSRLFPRSPRFGRYNLTYLPVDEVCEVDALSGSCMMVRREAMWGAGDGDWGLGGGHSETVSLEDETGEAGHPAPLSAPTSKSKAPTPNPDHKPDRVASGLREGLEAWGPTSEYDDWRYVDAEPLADPHLCDRIAVAVEAVQLERPADWEWGFFRVEDRIVAVHTRPSSDTRIHGRGPRTVGYVIDPDALIAGQESIVARFEAKWWRSRPE